MIPRPRIRLPLWSVPAIVVGLYAARSVVRGSWSIEWPMDAVILAMTAVVMILVAQLRGPFCFSARLGVDTNGGCLLVASMPQPAHPANHIPAANS